MEFGALRQILTSDLKGYKSIPFWSWNNHIKEEALLAQIEDMYAAGIGGFIMHARSGLKGVEYLGEQWFSCIAACLKKAKELGLEAWVYDENGWPSGIVGGKLLEREDFLSSYMTLEERSAFDKSAFAVYVMENGDFRRVKAEAGSGKYYCVYLKKNPSYTDILNPNVVDEFIKETHEKYYERFKDSFGKELVGFFTDEPQCCSLGVPYSPYIAKEYEKTGKDIKDGLVYLFFDNAFGYKFKYDYYSILNYLYVHNYYEKLYDWCSAHGCKLTGHAINEEKLTHQMCFCAGVMPTYEYEHIPAVDWLGRDCETLLTFKQIGSAAQQLGKKQVLTETFACSGHDVNPRELKSIAEMQYFNGVNKMCHHLYPYSLASQGKYDCPPVFSRQSNWFAEFKVFNDYFNRLGYIISNTKEEAEVCVIHPVKSLYLSYVKADTVKLIETVDKKFEELLNELAYRGVSYHIADETILQNHGGVQDGKLVVGNCAYNTVIVPEMQSICKTTYNLLKKFKGKLWVANKIDYIDGVKFAVDLASNVGFGEITEKGKFGFKVITGRAFITERKGAIGDFLFIKNVSKNESCKVSVSEISGEYALLDLENLSLGVADDEFSLGGAESVILYKAKGFGAAGNRDVSEKDITKQFTVSGVSENYFVLDKASYSLDGVNFSKEKNIKEIFEYLLRQDYRGNLVIRQSFAVKEKFAAKLLVEKAKYKYLRLNGKDISLAQSGFDIEFAEADIGEGIVSGGNLIEYALDFYEHDGVRYALFDTMATESVRNCLYYDTSLENAYIVGDFIVKKDLSLTKRCGGVDKFSHLEKCGYPFFYGNFTLTGILSYDGKSRKVMSFKGRFLTAEITCGGKSKSVVLSDKTDITDLLKRGENVVQIKVKSSLRNLFGPHHNKLDVEKEQVFPTHFTMLGEWKNGKPKAFTEKYSLVQFGIDRITLISTK